MPEIVTPDLTGQANKYLKVNAGETGYEFGTPGGGPGAVNWGDVGGTLSDQTDLQAELDGLDAAKLDNPTGNPDGTKYLRDDNTWQPIVGGSGLAQYQVRQILRR